MELHLYDQNCHLCKPKNRNYLHEFCLTYRSITFVVHFCCHYYGKDWLDAACIVSELYDDIETSTHWRNTGLSPAMHYGLRHKGYWQHECEDYHRCGACGKYAYNEFKFLECGALIIDRRIIYRFSKDSDAVSDVVDKRFCDKCYRIRVDRLLELNEREMNLWLEQQILERRKLSQLRKLQGLFSEAKKALRQNKDHEALQLLKEEFEQAASLPE